MALILSGAPVAAAITEELIARREALNRQGVEPCLAILRVGARGDDLAYERGAIKRCEKVGIRVVPIALPEDCTQAELMAEIEKINGDDRIHGCLMFRPIPKHLDEDAACEALKTCKDVDSMTAASLKTVFTGRGEGYAPCTAQSCIELLKYYGIDPAGKRAAVIGRSLVIGRPVSMMLQAYNATVTMCHTNASFTNPDQVVIDVGINVLPDGSICGDVCFDEVEPKVRAISPVPSGVGSVTTAVLCKHVIEAAEKTLQETLTERRTP